MIILPVTFLNLFGNNGDSTNNWREGKGLINQWRDGIGHMKRWKENWNNEAKYIIEGACSISAETQDNLIFWAVSAGVLLSSILISIGKYLFQ